MVSSKQLRINIIMFVLVLISLISVIFAYSLKRKILSLDNNGRKDYERLILELQEREEMAKELLVTAEGKMMEANSLKQETEGAVQHLQYLLEQEKEDYKKLTKQYESIANDKHCLLMSTTNIVLNDIRTRNYERLSHFFHPTSGVRFTQYGTVSAPGDEVVLAQKFRDGLHNQKKFFWGLYDAETGESEEGKIIMTIPEYFDEFVYPVDFLKHPRTKLETSTLAPDNAREVYGDSCFFSDWYFEGFVDNWKHDTWVGLRLVFKEHKDQYYLVGIIQYRSVI